MTPELKQAVERLRYRANGNIAGGSCADEDYDTLAIIAALEQAEAELSRLDAVLCASAESGKPAPLSERCRDNAAEAYRRKRDADTVRWAAKEYACNHYDGPCQAYMLQAADYIERGELTVPHGGGE